MFEQFNEHTPNLAVNFIVVYANIVDFYQLIAV